MPAENQLDDRELNEEIIVNDLLALNVQVKPLNKLVPPGELYYLAYSNQPMLVYDLVRIAIAKGVSKVLLKKKSIETN